MPRPSFPLDQFKEEIRHWIYNENSTAEVIAERVSARLGQNCTLRTIERRLQQWGFNRRNTIQESTELRLQIALLFQKSYNDANIVRRLNKDGQGPISERQVARIRKKMGFVRRMTIWERARADKQLIELVQQELDQGHIEGYGRSLLEKWFRQKGISTTRFDRTIIF